MIIKQIENNPKLSIFIISILMFIFNLDVLDVTIMEARNFITAREMTLDGNWLLTTMNGEPRYQKPPLPTWLAAISSFFFGLNNIYGMRLPGFLMVIFLVKYNYSLSHYLTNNKHLSLINGLITLTSFYIIGIVIEAPWDIFAHGFMLIGIFYLSQFFKREFDHGKNAVIAGFFIGLSIMSKGPVSIYALLLPFLIAYGCIYKFPALKAKWFSMFSLILVALLIGGWWYFYVRFQDPETFLSITTKETNNWTNYNVRPFYYYWSFFAQSGLWTLPAFISLIYPYLKTRVSNLKAYKFTLIWTLIAVILLSIIPEKKSRYLMPVLIPLALNIGFYIEYLIHEFKSLKDKREIMPVYLSFGLLGLVGISSPIIGYLFIKNILVNGWLQFIIVVSTLGVIGLVLIRSLIKKDIKTTFYLCIAFVVSIFVFALPLYRFIENDHYKPINTLKSQLDNNNKALFSIGKPSPEIIWNYGGKIQNLNKSISKNYPSEINIIIQANSKETIQAFETKYNIQFICSYNLNRVSKDSRGYKNRLNYDYYILNQK